MPTTDECLGCGSTGLETICPNCAIVLVQGLGLENDCWRAAALRIGWRIAAYSWPEASIIERAHRLAGIVADLMLHYGRRKA